MFLQMKTQASGYPSNVTTHEQKNKYIRQYEKHEGVHLDPNKIEIIQVYIVLENWP